MCFKLCGEDARVGRGVAGGMLLYCMVPRAGRVGLTVACENLSEYSAVGEIEYVLRGQWRA